MTGLPGVIETIRFIRPGSKGYQGYIDYMNRNEAARNAHFNEYSAFSPTNYDDSLTAVEKNQDRAFQKFNDYMGNPYKTEALFSAYSDQLNEADREKMKTYFTQAQNAKSPLWQIVYSFDNQWLIEHDMLNPKTAQLDTKKVYAATRASLENLETKTGLRGQWTGAVHYNTDNIHVHVGYVEREPTREWIYYNDKNKPALSGWQYKGSLKKKDIRAAKSTFINRLLSLEPELAKSEKLIQTILKSANENKAQLLTTNYEQLVSQLIAKLPANRNQWAYGYAEKKGFKTELDQVTQLYLKQQTPTALDELIKTLQPISQEYERAYGNPNHKATYAQNKLAGKDGLYYKFGNSILKTLKTTFPEQTKQHGGRNITTDEIEQLRQSATQGERTPPKTGNKQFDRDQALDQASQLVAQYLKQLPPAEHTQVPTIEQVIDHPKHQDTTKKAPKTKQVGQNKADQAKSLPELTQQLNQVSNHHIKPEPVQRTTEAAKPQVHPNNLYNMRRLVSMLTGNLNAIQATITSEQRQKAYEHARN